MTDFNNSYFFLNLPRKIQTGKISIGKIKVGTPENDLSNESLATR